MLLKFPNDSGPIYRETIEGNFIIEPWNTASNLIFLAIVFYWSFRVYKDAKKHKFLALGLPTLLIGYIGGTIYHATRSHEIWLLMDWVPIVLLCLSASVYFFIKLKIRRRIITSVVIFPFLLSFSLDALPLESYLSNLIGYGLIVLVILFPLFKYLSLRKWKHKKLVLLSLASFLIAISFRSIDLIVDTSVLYMGTHWLWHLFGGIAVHFLISYIYNDKVTLIRN
ncbi:hypothetical protein GTQ40_09135 [Flavobacteriaceae bacterium R38]|nr:hypothetical protein [Flavobacteriaceae bacterium R38]